MKKHIRVSVGALLALSTIAISSNSFAEGAPASPINSGDTAWMMISAALVMLMTPGLAFFYAGMVRSKNAGATIMQSFIALPVISFLWMAFGYSMAFSHGSGILGGFSWAFLNGVGSAPSSDYSPTIPHSLFAIYQCMFAVITPALISGAFAERMKFKSYLAFIALWSLFVYSPVAHWVWGVGGFLRDSGTLDFAGGLVVHQTAGFSALAAAIVFGKRVDYGKAEYVPHNIPLIVIGTALLWFGWFGFNAGSAIGSNELSVSAFTATHFGAAGATLSWMLLEWAFRGKPSLTGACIGAVVGLVAITPASGFVTQLSGLIIGLVAGAASNFAVMIRSKNGLDDSLDVFACHGVGGLVGALLTGLLASKAVNSAGADGSITLFLNQVKASGIVALFSFGVTFGILKVVNVVFGLRPESRQEELGLDACEHIEKAYS